MRSLSDRGAWRLEGHPAVGGEPHARGVGARDVVHAATLKRRRSGARVLDVGADADSKEAALAPRPCLLLARGRVVEHLQRGIERGGVVARVIWLPRGP